VHSAAWSIAAALGAAVVALVVVQLVHWGVLRLSRHSALWAALARHTHRPVKLASALIAVQLAVRGGPAQGDWQPALRHVIWLAVIGAVGWLVAALVAVFEDVALARFRTDVPDNRQARRVRTQVVMLRRITVAVVAVLAVAVMLTTFPQVRTLGASMLASAGLAGVVAALAAQSVLGNVFAGLQLAFSDAIRLDDVVVVEGEWGRVEELTLSYVVVQIWDDRRLILPTSYFTSTPFQNWTRSRAAVLGAVELDVDWSVPVPEIREELRRRLADDRLWDRRVCVLQVTEATGTMLRLRALVSAADAPTLWDLRCQVREHLVSWVRQHHPEALPAMRARLAEPTRQRPDGDGDGRRGAPDEDARVFSGSYDGYVRASAFSGPDDQAGRP
jgi:small-conductance mechanosensitive channel